MRHERPVELSAQETALAPRHDEQPAIAQPIDAEWKLTPSADDDFAVTVEIDRHDLSSAPVREPEAVLMPAWRLPHRRPAQQSPEDRATVFQQREHVSLCVAGDLSRLPEAGPLVEATPIAVVALDLDGQVFQALSSVFRQPCVEQPHPDAAPLAVQQYVDSRQLTDSADRRTNCANPMTSPFDSATKKLEPCAASARLKLSRELPAVEQRPWTSSGMMPA
jgi:hypothetical protein